MVLELGVMASLCPYLGFALKSFPGPGMWDFGSCMFDF